MSPTTYQKPRRIEVQEDKKITLLMWSPQCSTRQRGYKKVYKFVLIILSGKRFFLFEKHYSYILRLFIKLGLQDKSDDPPSVEDESHDHEADVSPNARPSEDSRQNCELQEARSLIDELMNKRKSASAVQCSQCS